jgi:hypothetical protein
MIARLLGRRHRDVLHDAWLCGDFLCVPYALREHEMERLKLAWAIGWRP